MGAAFGEQPFAQTHKLARGGAECPHLLLHFAILQYDQQASHDRGLMHIQSTTAFNQGLHNASVGRRLLRPSFVPPPPIRALRDLTRYRRKLVESQTAERNRLLKLLETANIKLASVASDVFGVSGRLMLRALVEGKATPQQMAELAKGASA